MESELEKVESRDMAVPARDLGGEKFSSGVRARLWMEVMLELVESGGAASAGEIGVDGRGKGWG